MTTLIVTDKAFYSDSRVTIGSEILTDDYEKIFKYSGYTIAITGNPCELKHHIKKYLDGDPVTHKTEGCCITHKNGETRHVKFYQDGTICDTIETFTRCFGSGAEWARAAMDFGKTPEEAIEYAKTRDTYSGGRVLKVLLENPDDNS